MSERQLPSTGDGGPPGVGIRQELQNYAGNILDRMYGDLLGKVPEAELAPLRVAYYTARHSILRASAVLDPDSLSDTEWARAQETTNAFAERKHSG